MMALYEEGASDAEVKVALAVPPYRVLGNDTWERLIADEPKFQEAVRAGRLISEAWWERAGRHGIIHPNFKVSLWIVQMRNRFGFKGADRNPGNPEDPNQVQFYLPSNGRDSVDGQHQTDQDGSGSPAD